MLAGERIKVYIAGPYTRPDPVENTHKACHAWRELQQLGFAPYCPHWTLLQHLIFPEVDVNVWYEADKEWLVVCAYLLRLPGESTGADAEVALALERGIPVVHSVDELLRRVQAVS